MSSKFCRSLPYLIFSFWLTFMAFVMFYRYIHFFNIQKYFIITKAIFLYVSDIISSFFNNLEFMLLLFFSNLESTYYFCRVANLENVALRPFVKNDLFNIYQILIYFYILFIYLFRPCHGLWDLVLQTGIDPRPSAMKS